MSTFHAGIDLYNIIAFKPFIAADQVEHHAGSITFLATYLCVSVSQMPQPRQDIALQGYNYVNVDDFDVDVYWYTDTPHLLKSCH